MDATSASKAKTCTWYAKHHPSKANGHGWHEYSKFKEFNKLVPKDKGKVKGENVAGYNLNTDSEVQGLIHQDAEVSTTAKWIFDSGACTHVRLDAVLFRDIRAIRSEVQVRKSAVIPIYEIGTVSLFVISKDGSIKNLMLKDFYMFPA
jgi:hypothetical protein